jgi:hypothetical protein
VCGDVLLDPRSRSGAPDDVREDRLLQASTVEPTEDRIGRTGLSCVAQLLQIAGEPSRKRLASGLVALPVTDEQRPLAAVELEVAPLERAQLGTTKAGRHEREQDELIALGEARQVSLRYPGGVEQASELLPRQPVALLPRLRRRVEVAERIGRTDTAAGPAEEARRRRKRR